MESDLYAYLNWFLREVDLNVVKFITGSMEILKQLLPVLVCLMVTPLEGAKILLSVPMVPGMHSHIFQMAELGEGLLHKGHDISWLVPNTSYVPNFLLKKPFKKVH